uniref:Uncharacterized protein n=1 Tax=Compsopogon caeruleus TaxID=31354 RepID=A0A6T6ASL1_9RHOD
MEGLDDEPMDNPVAGMEMDREQEHLSWEQRGLDPELTPSQDEGGAEWHSETPEQDKQMVGGEQTVDITVDEIMTGQDLGVITDHAGEACYDRTVADEPPTVAEGDHSAGLHDQEEVDDQMVAEDELTTGEVDQDMIYDHTMAVRDQTIEVADEPRTTTEDITVMVDFTEPTLETVTLVDETVVIEAPVAPDARDQASNEIDTTSISQVVTSRAPNDVELTTVIEENIELGDDVDPRDLIWADDETMLVACGDGRVRLWELNSEGSWVHLAFFAASTMKNSVDYVTLLPRSRKDDLRVVTISGQPRRLKVWRVLDHVAVLAHEAFVEEADREDGDILVHIPLADDEASELKIREAVKRASLTSGEEATATNPGGKSKMRTSREKSAQDKKKKEKKKRRSFGEFLGSLCGRV